MRDLARLFTYCHGSQCSLIVCRDPRFTNPCVSAVRHRRWCSQQLDRTSLSLQNDRLRTEKDMKQRGTVGKSCISGGSSPYSLPTCDLVAAQHEAAVASSFAERLN